MFLWEYVDGLWVTNGKDVGLIIRAISSNISSLCDPDPPTSQTDRRHATDGLCTIVHRAVKKTCVTEKSVVSVNKSTLIHT